MTLRYQVFDVFYTGEIVGGLEFESRPGDYIALTFDFRIKEVTSEPRSLEPVLEIIPGIFILSGNTIMEIPSGTQVGQVCQITLHCPEIYKTYEDAAGDLVKKRFQDSINRGHACA